MLWDHIRTAFEDELEKIAEISLRGLRPESVMAYGEPPAPFPSAAYERAMEVLQRAETIKLGAAPYVPNSPGAPKTDKDSPKPVQEAKSLGAHLLVGAGAGATGAGMAFHPSRLPDATKLHTAKWYGTAAGAGLGAAEYARRKLQARRAKSQEKTASGTPGQLLRASRQVGHSFGKGRVTPSLSQQTAGTIGR